MLVTGLAAAEATTATLPPTATAWQRGRALDDCWYHLPIRVATAIVRTEVSMGDKSPKSKQRDQQQKNAAKATGAAAAKSKQDAQSRAPLPNAKGKR